MNEDNLLTCPFCGFKDCSDYKIMYHIEEFHSETGDSPFVVSNAPTTTVPSVLENTPERSRSSTPSNQSFNQYVECPHKCGERIAATELQLHADLHLAENMALEAAGPQCQNHAVADISNAFSTSIPASLRNHDQLNPHTPPSSERKVSLSLKELFFGSPTRDRPSSKANPATTSKIRRLGRSELGPYAHEKRMPVWLQKMLEEGPQVTISNQIGPDGTLIRVETVANETPNLIHVLSRLSRLDGTVAKAFFCSPEVRHIVKMPREGGFCGYRNIQMLVSYIQHAEAAGCDHFPGNTPTILRLQDMIENAWDKGYNSAGRIETGGIKMTRKYIGTPEAQALFLSLGIPCEANAYTSSSRTEALLVMIQAVCEYFDDNVPVKDKIVMTNKAPIYFQHKGHSMTIVGIEIHNNGAANLVVFDPMFNPSQSVKSLTRVPTFHCANPAKLMSAYRRGEKYLSRYKEFELLKLRGPPSIPSG